VVQVAGLAQIDVVHPLFLRAVVNRPDTARGTDYTSSVLFPSVSEVTDCIRTVS
jgi:hypothetical protein